MDTDKILELQRRIEALEQVETIRKLKDQLGREQQEKDALKQQMIEFLASFQMVFDWDFSFTLMLLEGYIESGDLRALFDLVDPKDPCNNMGNLGGLYIKFHKLKKMLLDDV